MSDSTWLIVGLFGGILCGLGCVALAKTKNRNAVGFFFLGFLLGVIGLIVALFFPKREEIQWQPPAGESTGVTPQPGHPASPAPPEAEKKESE